MNSTLEGGAPRTREPMFFIPPVVLALVVALLAIQGALQFFDETARDQIYLDWGFIPARFTAWIAPQWIAELAGRAASDPDSLAKARLIRDMGVLDSGPRFATFLSYAWLHGSWAHVGINSIWIVAFGPPVARRFGIARFLAFFVFTSLAGAAAHWLATPLEPFPMIGASAADSGLMAAAARFMFQPGVRLANAGEVHARASTLRELLTDRRALIFIAIWMVTNFMFGAGATELGASDAPVAWVAHVGGFLAGLFGFGLFDRGDRRGAEFRG